MSASVASSAVGLLDRHYSPPAISPEANDATRWPEMMEIDEIHKVESLRNRSEPLERALSSGAQLEIPTEREKSVHAPSKVEQTDHDRQDAIGGLLAALATNGNSTTSQANADQKAPIRRSMTPPADSPISQTSQIDFAQVKEEGAMQESNDARLPNDDLQVMPNTQMSSFNDHDQSVLDQLDSVPFSAEDLASLPFPPLDMTMADLPPDLQDEIPINVRRQIDAYARLEFADGTFYLNTYQCELGRDQHAYRDALQRDREAREAKEAEESGKALQKSSSGKASQRSLQIKAESQVQGSVVSEAGGFAGVDDQPVASHSEKRSGQDGRHHSSQASETSIVRPADVLHNPSLLPYDYHRDVTYQPQLLAPVPENDLIEDEQPAPVTSEHLPDPNSCPLIPIHATLESDQTEAESLKAISRRHIRIYWDPKLSAFYMQVLGRNGAFFEDVHRKRGESVRLYTGARIQISAVEFVFRLPDVVTKRPEEEDDESSADSEELSESSPSLAPTTAVSGQPIKLKLKLNTDTSASQTAGPNGELKRRGPGRPPKNGIMSQREMKEREKAEKEAKARTLSNAASPPALQRKFSKSQQPNPETPPVADSNKAEREKRKYNKRKREDGEDDEVLPSIEAQEETAVVEAAPPPPPPQPIAKRARTKSFSPEYKPQDQCTPEDLARPPHNYAVLLYMVLSETGEITLRQIYKQMQSRWPYFKYVVDSDGWTSSVRHNLNQEVGKLFERGRKEGKGFTWLPKPNAMEEYQAQKNKRSNAPPVPKPRPPPQRPNYTGTNGQQLSWQNTTAVREPQQPGTYPHQGPWPPQPNGSKPNQPPNGFPNGQRPLPGQPPNMSINRDPNYIPPTHLLPQHFGRPAPRFMPVTFEGLAVIARFEQSMFQNLKQDEATQVKWRQIFASAKGRCLHGNEGSTLEGGETAEEATIIKHISDFVTRYKNPAFEGFKARTTQSPSLIGSNVPTTIPNPSSTPTSASTPANAPPSTSQNQTPAPATGPIPPPQSASQNQALQNQTPQNAAPQSRPSSTTQTAPALSAAVATQQPSQSTPTPASSGNVAVSSTSSTMPSQTSVPAQTPLNVHQGYPPPMPQATSPASTPRPAQNTPGVVANISAPAPSQSYPPPMRPTQSTTPTAATMPTPSSTNANSSAAPSVPISTVSTVSTSSNSVPSHVAASIATATQPPAGPATNSIASVSSVKVPLPSSENKITTPVATSSVQPTTQTQAAIASPLNTTSTPTTALQNATSTASPKTELAKATEAQAGTAAPTQSAQGSAVTNEQSSAEKSG